MLDPELLRNFLHVVEEGTLRRASGRAHITQPALSRQVQLLEEQLDCTLFERTGRGMRPTEIALRLEARARAVLLQLDSLHQEFKSGPVCGAVTLAVTPNAGMAWTARCIQEFSHLYPEVQLHVVVALSGAMGEAIAAGQYDLGILYSPVPRLGLTSLPLWEEEARFICPDSSSLAQRRSVTCRQVLESPLILPSSKYGVRALMEDQARKLGIPLHLVLEVDSVRLALELVRQGTGHLVLTERAMPDIRSLPLVGVPIRRPALVRAAQLTASSRSLRRPAVQALWEFLESRANP